MSSSALFSRSLRALPSSSSAAAAANRRPAVARRSFASPSRPSREAAGGPASGKPKDAAGAATEDQSRTGRVRIGVSLATALGAVRRPQLGS